MEGSYTRKEWIERFKSLDIKDQFNYLIKLQPNLNINENTGLTVTLVIDGLKQKAIEGQVIDDRRALTALDPKEVD